MPNALTRSNQVIKCRLCIKSWADALANLPSRARWFPQGDAAIRQRNGSCESSALLGQTMEGIFMSDTSKPTPDKIGMPFVDPWVKEPNHQGELPVDAVFVGAWRRYLGIDHLCEALFLVRDDKQ